MSLQLVKNGQPNSAASNDESINDSVDQNPTDEELQSLFIKMRGQEEILTTEQRNYLMASSRRAGYMRSVIANQENRINEITLLHNQRVTEKDTITLLYNQLVKEKKALSAEVFTWQCLWGSTFFMLFIIWCTH